MMNYFLRALRDPGGPFHGPSLTRQLVLRPRVLDLVSCYKQWRNLARQKRIKDKYQSNDAYFNRVQEYNADVTLKKQITRTRRAERLYKIVTLPPRPLRDEKLLIVGPRDVHELIMAWGYGYRWKNISGIDLYSTDAKIQVMNMEDTEFEASTFDAVTMASTLAYAQDTDKCIGEMARILKPGGRFVFGATYCPQSEWMGDQVQGNTIKDLLLKHGFEIYFYVPNDKINAKGTEQTSHIIGARKTDPNDKPFDRIQLT